MRPKPYKFQAFVTISAGQNSDPACSPLPAAATLPPGQLKRMAGRGEHHLTHGSHFFSALVADSVDHPDWIGGDHPTATVMLAPQDPPHHFSPRHPFAL